MGIEGTASRKVLDKSARKDQEIAWDALLHNPIPQLGGPGTVLLYKLINQSLITSPRYAYRKNADL